MEQKNIFLAVILSILVLVGFNYFFPQQGPAPQQAQTQNLDDFEKPKLEAPTAKGSTDSDEVDFDIIQPRADVLALSERVRIDSPVLQGSLNLTGARLDDIILPEFKETLEDDSPSITLLSPRGSKGAYYSQFNWVVSDGITAPSNDTVWTADKDVLVPGDAVTLSWTSPEGAIFQQVYGLDDNYMFTVTQKVANPSGSDFAVRPYGAIKRIGTPETEDFYILHEGFVGVFEKLEEKSYKDLREDGKYEYESKGGWIGITDKYWQAVLVPAQDSDIVAKFAAKSRKGDFLYQADFAAANMTVPAGGEAVYESHLFAGAKKAALLDDYGDQLGAYLFNRSVDFGMFHWLTEPMYEALHWLNGVLGNFGVAILVMTLVIKIFLLPLAHKSYVSMSRMKLLQPKMQELKERHGEDRQKLNQEMMNLYKKEKVNPLAGCLPILVQIPIFFALYKVLFINIEMRHAPFFGWVHDLSAPDPLGILTAFGMIDWQPGGLLALFNIGIWPIIMGLTMYLQQKLNPAPADPVQAKIFTFMPIMFTFMLGTFPAGLVIYWAWNNTLSIAQQYLIMKKMGVAIGGGKAETS